MQSIRFSLVIIGLCFSCWIQLFSSPTPHSGYQLEGYLKTKPLQQVAHQVLRFAQRLGIPQKKIALPSVMLGLMGHPVYSGLAKDENLAVFVYDTGEVRSPKYVACVRFVGDDPICKTLGILGCVFEKRGDWTLVARQVEDFKLVEDMDRLLKIVERPMAADIEVGYLFAHADQHTEALKRKWNMRAPSVTVLQQVMPHLHGMSLGVQFEEGGLAVCGHVRANPKTPEFTFLSQTMGSVNTVASYMPEGNLYSLAGQLDPQATRRYINYLIEHASEGLGIGVSEEGRAALAKLQRWMVKFAEQSDGSFAYSASLFHHHVRQLGIQGGSFTDHSLQSLLNERCLEIQNPLCLEYSGSNPLSFFYRFDWETSLRSLGQEGIHRIVEKVASRSNPSDFRWANETYAAAIKGHYIYSNDLSAMHHFLGQFQNGDTPANSLGEFFSADPGSCLQFHVSLEEMARQAILRYRPGLVIPDSRIEFEGSVLGQAKMAPGMLLVEAKVPYSTLAYVFQIAAKAKSSSVVLP